MLFTFDKTPENLYNMIVEAFISSAAPQFLTELTRRINLTKIAVLQKIGENGPIREALTRNDSKLRSFDLVDSRFKETLPNPIKDNVLVAQALPQPGFGKKGRSGVLRNVLGSIFNNKGGKKSIKRNNIRGITSKLRRRSSVRRKKTTRRKHN
jgi:hypothetical protein